MADDSRSVTDRVDAEAALRESEARFRALVAATADVLYRMSPDWGELRLLHGRGFLSDVDAPGSTWLSRHIPPEERQRVLAAVAEAVRTKSIFELEHRVVRTDGTLGWTHSRAVPLLDDDGEIVEWIGVASDVTPRRAAEAALRERESKYRSLFESIDEGFCIVEMLFDDAGRPVDYRFLEINPVFEEQTGMRDATGRRVRELVPDFEQYWVETYARIALTGEPARFTDHSPSMGRWFDVYAFRVGEPEARQVAVLFRDITARRRDEEALRESRAQLARVFELSPSFLALLDGPDHVFQLVNPAYHQLLGHRELVGRPVREAVPEVESQGFFELLDGVYRTGEPFVGSELPVQLQRVPGAPLERRYVNFIYQPLRDAADAVHGILATGIDVTELVLARQATERALAETERAAAERDAERRQLRTVLEQSPLAIAILEPSGEIRFRNPAFERIWGRTPAEISTDRFSDAYTGYHLDGRPVATAEWPGARALQGEVVEGEVLEVVRTDGRRLRVWINAAPVRDAAGRVTGAVVITRDVTTEHRLEEEVRATQRLQAVGTLAGGVAHEINNQMTAVLGFGEFVLKALGPEHPQAEDMRLVLHSAGHAARISQQLLAFTRQQVTRRAALELPALLTRLAPVLRQLLGTDKTLLLAPPESEPLPPILADADQVEQVLINLVANARDATETGARVTITLRDCVVESELPAMPGEPVAPGRYVRLTVTDTGQGMSAQTLERIFDPFFTTKEVGKGAGLGLSMVYGTLRRHGGYVRARSAPGLGTSMELYWPVADGGVEQGGADAAAAAAAGVRRLATVLVVEDEPVVQALAVRALEDEGYEVAGAPDGAAALAMLEEGQVRPDLIVTDVIMPGLNGRQLDDAVRARWPGIPVLYISGHTGDAVVRERLVPAGAAFLGKPFTPDALSRAVRELLEAARAGRRA